MTTSLNRQAIISGTIYLYILLDNNSPRTIRKLKQKLEYRYISDFSGFNKKIKYI